jgi:hypothetical protein
VEFLSHFLTHSHFFLESLVPKNHSKKFDFYTKWLKMKNYTRCQQFYDYFDILHGNFSLSLKIQDPILYLLKNRFKITIHKSSTSEWKKIITIPNDLFSIFVNLSANYTHCNFVLLGECNGNTLSYTAQGPHTPDSDHKCVFRVTEQSSLPSKYHTILFRIIKN